MGDLEIIANCRAGGAALVAKPVGRRAWTFAYADVVSGPPDPVDDTDDLDEIDDDDDDDDDDG